MKKSNILIPIAAIGTLGAAITPMAVLTSCGGTGKNADLTKGYTPSIAPAATKIYKGATAEADALKDYLAELQDSNAKYEILQEDVKYSYAEAFQTETFKSMGFVFDSYTLGFDEMEVNESPSCTINTKFIAHATGSYHNEQYNIHVTDGDFYADYKFHNPFKVSFHKADNTTWKKMNYLSFVPDSEYTVTYTLKGSFKYNGTPMECPGKEVTDHIFLDYNDTFGLVTDLLIIEGLSCNLKTWAEKGIVYTYHYQNAQFQD